MKKIILGNKEIEYSLRRHKRVKNMKLSVYHDGSVVVTVPIFFSLKALEDFLMEHGNWIIRKIESFSESDEKDLIKTDRKDYLKNKERARKFIHERVEYFNKYYNFKFQKIRVKNQKTLWGSCSEDGNLNFNYAIIKLPKEMADYIVVHEMCHLWHFDHSRDFWELVGRVIPNCPKIRRKFKKICLV